MLGSVPFVETTVLGGRETLWYSTLYCMLLYVRFETVVNTQLIWEEFFTFSSFLNFCVGQTGSFSNLFYFVYETLNVTRNDVLYQGLTNYVLYQGLTNYVLYQGLTNPGPQNFVPWHLLWWVLRIEVKLLHVTLLAPRIFQVDPEFFFRKICAPLFYVIAIMERY